MGFLYLMASLQRDSTPTKSITYRAKLVSSPEKHPYCCNFKVLQFIQLGARLDKNVCTKGIIRDS